MNSPSRAAAALSSRNSCNPRAGKTTHAMDRVVGGGVHESSSYCYRRVT
jgi:hypothetical protein